MLKNLPLIFARAQGRLGVHGLQPSASEQEATIYLYDIITPYADEYWGGISANDFVRALNDLTAPNIHLRINSPGGDVFDARAIATAIRNHPSNIIAHIDALAASAATTVAMACDEVRMAQGAMMMIHRAWTFSAGNAFDLRKEADVLEKIDGIIAADYARKGNQSEERFLAMMDAETWLALEDCLALELIDQTDEPAADPAAAASNSAQRNLERAQAWLAALQSAGAPAPNQQQSARSTARLNDRANDNTQTESGSAAHARARALALM